MDIAAIGSLLTSLKTASDIAKIIRESGSTLEAAETKLKLADMMTALAEAKLNAAEIQQSLLDRDQEIRRLKAAAKQKADLKWKQPCYVVTNNDGIEEPFCQKCYDENSLMSRLHTDGKGYFSCHVCNYKFKTLERQASDSSAKRVALTQLPSQSKDW